MSGVARQPTERLDLGRSEQTRLDRARRIAVARLDAARRDKPRRHLGTDETEECASRERPPIAGTGPPPARPTKHVLVARMNPHQPGRPPGCLAPPISTILDRRRQ